MSFYFHFSHWTYDVTGGYLNVIDLQGVDRSDKYILTDPCIHCYEPRFGNTNLGQVGMKFFFQTHRCGTVVAIKAVPFYLDVGPSFYSSLEMKRELTQVTS